MTDSKYPTVALTFTVEQLASAFREQGIDVTDDQMVRLLAQPKFVKTLRDDLFYAWSDNLMPMCSSTDFGEIFTDFLTFNDDGELTI
jgi:hypothetical protein